MKSAFRPLVATLCLFAPALPACAVDSVTAPIHAADHAEIPRLWYDKPASQDWMQALPLGNGRLGGMVFGGVRQDRLMLNESSLWSGWPAKDNDRPGADAALTGATFDVLLARHSADHRALFDRVTLDLGPTDAAARALPTDARLARYRKTKDDRGLEALLFQYGRYLLIASSRPGGLPANLQGIWNNTNSPAWYADYHLNINRRTCGVGMTATRPFPCCAPKIR